MASLGDSCPSGKSEWPELVGVDGKVAVATIKRENTNVDVIVVLEGSMVTADVRCDRVWVWVNSCDAVVRAPKIG